ncbi:hypothetical protein [uncultured Nostoc sp.]|uniref:hypothetical protein n=1 Tax=uncultured Nostoc sp. TaxID=340711 RepID=UPI0035CC4BB9
MKGSKTDARKALVSTLRHVGLELNSLATEVEQLGQLPKVESRIKDLPGMISIMRKAAWEVQQTRFDIATELLNQINTEIAQEQLDALEG